MSKIRKRSMWAGLQPRNSLVVRTKSKYTPHQGKRECERRMRQAS